MRRILSALALCALGFAANSEPASAEITYPWCAEYGGRDGGGRNCGFWTYQQCVASACAPSLREFPPGSCAGRSGLIASVLIGNSCLR
jgi:Protein of unknown function (DUF3551)